MASRRLNTGVYVIEHIASGRLYVGSAANILHRWKTHLLQLREGRHHSRHMQRCWNKYGQDAFRFNVVLLCDRQNLLSYEQALIDSWKPAFNSAPTAGSQLGYKHRPESKARMSEAAKLTRNFTGHRHSEETKRRISESRKGKGGGPRSTERLAKISAALKGRPCPVERRIQISETLTGTSTGRGSLTPDQVRQARVLRGKGYGRIRIAKAMGISQWAADAVIGRHAYLWVT